MRCPQCGFDNPPGTNFCGRCGTGLQRTCPACGALNPDGFAFCGTCGTRLTPPAPDARAIGQPGLEERKVVTILFADLQGSTALGEQLDPEQVRGIMGRFFEAMADVITEFGGTVEKFIGDEVMAVFGLPQAHEDDAARAVRAAAAMHDRLGALTSETGIPAAGTLRMRIGINTGEVIANPQAAAKGEFMVTGDAVNVAARLRSAAEPGGTIVGDRTHRETAALAEYGACPPLTLKGKSEPMQAWEFTGLRAEPLHRERGGLRAPMTGRDDELGLLRMLFNRVLHERRPHLVTVLGIPGVGKTRLFEELTATLPDAGVRVGRSLPYGSTSLWAVGEIIRADCAILRSDPQEMIRRKLLDRGADLFADSPRRAETNHITAQLGRVLALPPAEDVPVDDSREGLFWALRRYFEALAAQRPLILAFEDIHSGDPELLDFVEYLAQWAAGVPLFIVCLARSELLELRPHWGGGKRNYTALHLEPLAGDATQALLARLLRTDAPPAEVARAVGAAEGNPFFMEEILRMLIDAGTLRRRNGGWEVATSVRLAIPDTVQGVVTARLDRLRTEEKSALQDAAVLGKDFWSGALVHLTGRTLAQLAAVLDALQAKDFLVEQPLSRLAGQREFSFKHLITHDVAYGMLPKARRSEKHRAFGVWLEQTLGDRVPEFAELLAHHWREAARLAREVGRSDQWDPTARKALQYALLAGQKAAGVYANDQAVTHFKAARGLAEDLGAESDRVAAIEGLADVYALQAQWEQASPLYQEALDYHQRRGDPVRQAHVQSRIASTFSGVFDFRQALPHIQSAIESLKTRQDERELSGIYLQMARTQTAMGNFADAEQFVHRGLDLATRFDLTPQIADGQWTLAFINSLLGRAEALEHYARCIDIAERAGDVGWTITAYSWRAWRHRIHGDYAAAIADYTHALALAEETNNRPRIAFCCYGLGMTDFLRGEWTQAAQFWTRYLAMSEEVPSWPEQTRSNLAFLAGDHDDAVAWAIKAIAHGERRREISSMGVARDWAAFLYLRLRQPSAAAKTAAEGLEQLGPLGVLWPAYLHPLAAEAALERGDLEAAAAHAARADAYLPLDIKVARARLLRVRSRLAQSRGAGDEAVAEAGAAVQLCEQFGNLYELAISRETLARALRQHGDTLAADAEFQQTVETYQRLGLQFEINHLR
jgi:class 3 adenylate cyclase/tetratricopeptide (TPR) repeat protein